MSNELQAGWMRDSWVEFYHDDDNNKMVRIRDLNRKPFKRIDAGDSVGLGYKLLKGTRMRMRFKQAKWQIDIDSKDNSDNAMG
jgi:hypothetical protein